MIEVEKLTKRFGEVEALRGVSFEVDRGQVVGLLGPNGAGKSTAMRILTGYLTPTSGSARIDGIEVADDPIPCQRKIGYLPEGNPLYTELRAVEALHFAAALHGVPRVERRKGVSAALDAVGLKGLGRRTIGTFSKGQRQRVGLAQALLHQPEILILDEPTSGLDPNQVEEMRTLIRELGEERTIILSTHILSEVEASCSQVVIIGRGELIAQGTVDEIKSLARGSATGGARLRLRASAAEALPILERLDFVASTQVLRAPAEDGVIEVRVVLDRAITSDDLESLATAVVHAGLPLSGLSAERVSMEETFAQLTRQEPARESEPVREKELDDA